jgi:hypothetical protein
LILSVPTSDSNLNGRHKEDSLRDLFQFRNAVWGSLSGLSLLGKHEQV